MLIIIQLFSALTLKRNLMLSSEVLFLSCLCLSRRDRMDPLVFQFQFKNVEYSSGRNKTFLCYLVDAGKADEGLQRGYLEDEHSGSHAEEAFFTQCLPQYDPALKYTVTWYIPPPHRFPVRNSRLMWVDHLNWPLVFPLAAEPGFLQHLNSPGSPTGASSKGEIPMKKIVMMKKVM